MVVTPAVVLIPRETALPRATIAILLLACHCPVLTANYRCCTAAIFRRAGKSRPPEGLDADAGLGSNQIWPLSTCNGSPHFFEFI